MFQVGKHCHILRNRLGWRQSLKPFRRLLSGSHKAMSKITKETDQDPSNLVRVFGDS